MLCDLVPAPRHLTLERQLNKSVLIGWNPPDQYGHHQIESYHVYVDGNLKVTVKAAERTRALVEGVDCNRVSSQQKLPSLFHDINLRINSRIE
jgi:RIMS-binding protein 2